MNCLRTASAGKLVQGPCTKGFTLIELSIVLVIIGLIVGGVLAGQDLIRAASVRAQISQIEKYNTAVNTFRDKYGGLPGDLSATSAAQFGFMARSGSAGAGDGNGVIEGNLGDACAFCENVGEPVAFWEDLSTAQLIEGNFSTATIGSFPPSTVTGAGINLYYPQAKIGNSNYIYVWSGGPTVASGATKNANSDGNNYFGLSAVTSLAGWQLLSSPGITPAQAYAIDKKIDDGFPQSGSVIAMYLNGAYSPSFGPIWAGTGTGVGAPYTTATPGSSTSCYDNGNTAGAPQQYSVEVSNGANVNCALSFRFQ